jgi:2-dehydro-3-deoxygalactonokinase
MLDEVARAAVADYAAAHPQWDGVICIAGDPTHWVHLSAGEVISFQSFLTARLARALGAGMRADPGAVTDSMARPERLATHLRSAELGGNRDEILGHLIGAEIAAARPYWLGREVVVTGEAGLAEAYGEVLGMQGVAVRRAG